MKGVILIKWADLKGKLLEERIIVLSIANDTKPLNLIELSRFFAFAVVLLLSIGKLIVQLTLSDNWIMDDCSSIEVCRTVDSKCCTP